MFIGFSGSAPIGCQPEQNLKVAVPAGGLDAQYFIFSAELPRTRLGPSERYQTFPIKRDDVGAGYRTPCVAFYQSAGWRIEDVPRFRNWCEARHEGQIFKARYKILSVGGRRKNGEE